MIETSLDLIGRLRQSSGNVRKTSGKVWKRSPGLWTNFGKYWEIFGKWSEIFGKSPLTSLCIVDILHNKQKITWLLGDFIFSC